MGLDSLFCMGWCDLEKFVADGFDGAGFEGIAAGVMFLEGEWLALDGGDATVAGVFAGEEKWRGIATEVAVDAGVFAEIFAGFLLCPVRWC